MIFLGYFFVRDTDRFIKNHRLDRVLSPNPWIVTLICGPNHVFSLMIFSRLHKRMFFDHLLCCYLILLDYIRNPYIAVRFLSL